MSERTATRGRSGLRQILVGSLATAIMIAALAWSIWDSWLTTLAESRRATAQIAAAIASQADETLGRAAATAEDLRRQVIRDPELLTAGNPRLAELIANLGRAAPPGIGISLANADGLLVGASANADLRGGTVSIAQQPSFKAHRNAGLADASSVRISPPFLLRTRNVLAFVLSVGLRDEGRGLLGVAAVSIPAAQVLHHLDPIRRGVATHIALVHRDGYVLAVEPRGADPMPARPPAGWIPNLVGKVASSEMESPFSRRGAIVSHQELAGYPVYAVVARDVPDLLQTWGDERSGRFALYGLMIAAAIGLNLWLVRAVHGRLRAEAALRESTEGRFREFTSIASDWFWETDAEHRFIFVSEGVSSLGVPPEAFLGKTRSERGQALPGPVSARLLALEMLMDEHQPIRDYVFDSWRPNGDRCWVAISAEPLRGADGVFRGYRGVTRDVTALHEAQARIAESEARLTDSINSMPIGYALWNARDRLVAWNRRYVELWPTAIDLLQPGITFNAFIEKALRRAWPGLSEDELQSRVAERIARHADCSEAWVREFPDGRTIEFSEVRTSEGGIVSLYADVTEAQNALKRLGHSEARFRDGIESMADGFSLWDADDRLIAWNSRFAAIVPIEAEVLRPGIGFAECMDHLERGLAARDPDWDWRGFVSRRRVRRTALGVPTEVWNIHGTCIEMIEHATSDGGVVSIYRDVTEARLAARLLAQSEARFHDFADAASDWFWESGPDHRFTHMSAGLRSVGLEPSSFIGRTREEYARFRGAEPPPELAELQELMGRREVIRGFCYPSSPDRDGNCLTLELHAKPIFDAAGTFLGYRGIGRDVTLRNRQQEELARALAAEREMNAQQRRFVSIASHEFRTPLAVIDGASQRLMARLAGGDDDVQKRLDRIRGAVSRMTELIERTLSSARLDDGRIELELRGFDLSQLLRDVADRQRQISPSFEIVLEGTDGDLPVDGDAKLLEQVFANLLSNAVKYSGRARRVEVTALESGASLKVAVRDRGLGVPPDEVPQLFTRFFRARTSMGIPGTGIGLHLVRELVQMHGGTVDVASEVGKGSTFTVTLPRRHRSAAAAE
jgi:PAS domain S-box-containing protein